MAMTMLLLLTWSATNCGCRCRGCDQGTERQRCVCCVHINFKRSVPSDVKSVTSPSMFDARKRRHRLPRRGSSFWDEGEERSHHSHGHVQETTLNLSWASQHPNFRSDTPSYDQHPQDSSVRARTVGKREVVSRGFASRRDAFQIHSPTRAGRVTTSEYDQTAKSISGFSKHDWQSFKTAPRSSRRMSVEASPLTTVADWLSSHELLRTKRDSYHQIPPRLERDIWPSSGGNSVSVTQQSSEVMRAVSAQNMFNVFELQRPLAGNSFDVKGTGDLQADKHVRPVRFRRGLRHLKMLRRKRVLDWLLRR